MTAGTDHADPITHRLHGIVKMFKAMTRKQEIERAVIDVIESLRVAMRFVVDKDVFDQRKQLNELM